MESIAKVLATGWFGFMLLVFISFALYPLVFIVGRMVKNLSRTEKKEIPDILIWWLVITMIPVVLKLLNS